MSTTSIPLFEIQARIDRARAAQRDWSKLPTRQRLGPVRAFRRLLVREADSLANVIAHEVGKTPIEALGGEALPTADACRFLERSAESLLAPRRVSGRLRPIWLLGQSDVVHRRPRGVVGIIGTWNYPLFLNGVQILQALVAGNAVVWKPSEVTPQFAAALHALLLEAGFLADLIVRLPATREMGPLLVESSIDHVVFTGSAAVGRKLAARLGERLISSTLELSGCDLQLVLPDADPKFAARAAWFGMTLNRGQTCIAVRRAVVHRSLLDTFCESLRSLTAQAEPVSLTLDSQQEQARRLISEALASGAKLLAQSPQSGDCRPVVLLNVRPEMAICQQALFAPVMAVLPFDTLEEALAIESQCPYALGASIFTQDLEQGRKLAAELRAGTIVINDVIVPTSHPATPFGGRAESGWGVTQGAEGLLEMTVPQVVSIRRGTFRPHYEMGDPEKLKKQGELLRGFLEALHAPKLGQRLGGWWRILRTAWKGW